MCGLNQSRVWLLTLTFIGGSGGEGSAKAKESERKLTSIDMLTTQWNSDVLIRKEEEEKKKKARQPVRSV